MAKSKSTLRTNGKPRCDAAQKSRLSQNDVPSVSLDQALRVPTAIIENYGNGPVTALQLAEALMMQPTGGAFRQLCGASIAFGLTEGGYNAQEISLSALARRILRPEEEGDDLNAKREAVLRPRVVREFLQKYNGSTLPRLEIGHNVLIAMGVPQERAESVFELIHESALAVGFIRDIKGREYVDLSGVAPLAVQPSSDEIVAPVKNLAPSSNDVKSSSTGAPAPLGTTAAADVPPLGQAIFVGHGKNKVPLEQLKGILDGFKIPYRIAIDSPNLGRPIGEKVAQTMRECNCAILLFTADEEFQDKDGNTIWRPSENVVHELGASSYLYGKRIVILKEDVVKLPSNFRDIGYIEFAKDALAVRSMDVLKELIGFGIVKVTT